MAGHVALAALAVALLGAGAGGAAAPRFGGTIVFATPSEAPVCLNPYNGTCIVGVHPLPVVHQVLAGALAPTPEFTYAEGLVSEVTYTKNPFTVTYKIRPQARWSDGFPVTAADFQFTFGAVLALDDNPGPTNVWRRVRRVVAVDAKTVRVVFRAPTSYWRTLFEFVLPRHALAGEDLSRAWRNTIDNPKTGRLIGSGPFLVQHWERGKELVLVRNPRYWGPRRAYADRLVFRWRVEADTVRGGGDVDLVVATGRPEAAPQLARDPGLTVLAAPAASFEQLSFQLGATGHPLLQRKLVRQAIAYGLDRDAIAAAVYRGLVRGASALQSALAFPGQSEYRPNWSRYGHRPAEAERLLDLAGCRRGADGVRSCDGRRLSFRAVTNAGVPRRELTLELVKEQLRRIGIEIKPEYARLFGPGGVLVGRRFELALFGYASTYPEADNAIYLCNGEGNFRDHCDRLLDRDLAQLPLVLDADARTRVLNDADRKLAEAVPLIPLYQAASVVAFKKSLKGVVLSPFLNRITYRAEDWWLAPSQ